MLKQLQGIETRTVATATTLMIAICFLASESMAQAQLGTTKRKEDEAKKPIWNLVDVDTTASLRGLHVFDAKHIFASGTGGTVVQSRDGGESWSVQSVVGAEALDFRDIHAIDPNHLVIMSSGSPARYRSKDGGQSWAKTFERTDEKYFLDAIAFWDDKNGLVMGDPIDGHVLLLRTTDAGNSWKQIEGTPKLMAGEAGFAASGTNMVTVGENQVFIALGGAPAGQTIQTSRVLLTIGGKRGKPLKCPFPAARVLEFFRCISLTAKMELQSEAITKMKQQRQARLRQPVTGGKPGRYRPGIVSPVTGVASIPYRLASSSTVKRTKRSRIVA
jgi:hypothetical protein